MSTTTSQGKMMKARLRKGCGWSRILACTALVTIACHGNTEAPPAVNVLESCTIGTKLGPDGNVAAAQAAFSASEPVYLTLRSASAAPQAHVTIEILDSHGEEMKSLFGPLGAGNMVTFPVRNLPAGKYTAKGSLGDRKLCELSFEIR